MARRCRRTRRSSGLNLLVAVNKPYGMVTRKLDNEVANALQDDGVGHIGTLDPAVTGVVVLCVGQACKLISLIEDGKKKSYDATIEFGTQTDTDDAQGSVIRSAAVPACVGDEAYARQIVSSFVGEQDQVPPKYSAIKVDGVRAYDRARAGEEFELTARRVCVFDAALLGIEGTEPLRWKCSFSVSAGTYVRALARDMGVAVGSAAHLAELCRVSSGNVELNDCVTLDAVRQAGKEGIASVAIDPAKVLGLPIRRLSAQELAMVQNGRSIACAEDLAQGQLVSLVRDQRLYGVWTVREGRLYAHTNCPLGIEGVRT
ncbi:MAG: tRNA pseudouridine(55) synthase TruB [Coriobacteriales bacterium]|nr:tRNA pseudouridine(55) synthase TruB [Coriobacteriales bacterium]